MTAGLERLGYSTSDVTRAVVSHLHQDHIGGIGEIPGAELLVSDDEWRSLHRPMAETRGLLRAHIDLPDAKWRPITYEPVDDPALRPFTVGHDLFGDGSLTVLPTPGHTPGSMSMFVRRSDGPPLLLVGDLTYDVHTLERGVSGGVGSKRAAARHAHKGDGAQSEPSRHADPCCSRSCGRRAPRCRDSSTRSRFARVTRQTGLNDQREEEAT